MKKIKVISVKQASGMRKEGRSLMKNRNRSGSRMKPTPEERKRNGIRQSLLARECSKRRVWINVSCIVINIVKDLSCKFWMFSHGVGEV